jgi:APA family basic amino acid/polyamine antiporter
LFDWIIGWDLILEYAVGSATVVNGWSGYFQSVLAKFGVHLPAALAGPPIIYDTTAGHFVQTAGIVNLPAIVIVALVTAVLVKGIQESAGFNTTMVFLKVTVVLFVILVGAFYINPANWSPFAPYGLSGLSFFGQPLMGQVNGGGQPVGMLAGAASLFCLHWIRLGVTTRGGSKEPHA